MIIGKEDLGLSLGLGTDSNNNNFLNSFFQQKMTTQWSDLASEERRPKGIDVNRLPVAEEEEEHDSEEEEVGPCSPNSTVSSVMSGGKRDHRMANINNVAEENDMERAYCSSRGGGGGGGGISDEDDGDGSRKKLRLSKDQSAVLEESFKEHNTLNPKQKLALAKQLNLRARQVEVWFQNRRARTKLKQTEVDCEFLKRCCENLTDENRRLQKEVSELRALKLSPQLYMHMTPPTTLTMCPSCERISSSSSSSSAAPPAQTNHYQHRAVAPAGGPWPPIPLRASFPPMQRS